MAENYFKCHVPARHIPATIIAIKTARDKTHSEDDVLIEYEYMEQVKGFVEDEGTSIHARRAEIRAKKDGTVESIHVAKGDVIRDESTVVIEYKGCDHDTQYGGMCVECLKEIPVQSKSHVNMTHDATSLSVSRTEAKRLGHNTAERLLTEGKLSLIVDLDQTLIHATFGAAIDEWVNAQGGLPKDIRMFPLPDSTTPYYIKLRPYLEMFLQKVTSLYELHIYTMGTRNYAAAVANVIDPDGKFFGQRILSRDENASMTQKTIERLFPCDTSMVVVIDDRADVWQYSPNLVKVHPYEYFVGAGDINAGHLPKQEPTVKVEAPPAPDSSTAEPIKKEAPTSEKEASTSEKEASASDTTTSTPSSAPVPTDEIAKNKPPKPRAPVLDDKDSELKFILNILEDIHEQFYDAREKYLQGESKRQADVKAIITEMKRNVLRGLNLVFSGVIPLGQEPARTDIWRQAQAFGAECSTDVNSKVTHVIAAKPGTEKVAKARRRKDVKVVRPEWFFHSIGRWRRQDESLYLHPDKPGKPAATVTAAATSTTPPPMTETEEDTGVEEDEDDQGGISEGMDENHRPLSIGSERVNEKLMKVNWDDMDKEVEEFVGDLDDTDFDSDTSTHSNAQSDVSTDGNSSPLINLKRARIPRRSGLGASVTYASSDDDEDENNDAVAGMDGIVDYDEADRKSGESDGDIGDESGSADESNQGGSDAESEEGRQLRRHKRRRVSRKNGVDTGHLGLEPQSQEIDADDEVTMDYSKAARDAEGADIDEDEEEYDDDEFLKNLENDIDAELNDEDENGEDAGDYGDE
ncbi:Carboxy-terminal domain (CTD) phosphatase [Haplosporangium sp. Z 11]|nr:Carboxy-terminal domain (CTD) phosphatase [Haplosporangium sp. Z 11]